MTNSHGNTSGTVLALTILAALPIVVAMLALVVSVASFLHPPDPCLWGLVLAGASYELVVLLLGLNGTVPQAAFGQSAFSVGVGIPVVLVGYLLVVGSTLARVVSAAAKA
jgi:hypothetical protein